MYIRSLAFHWTRKSFGSPFQRSVLKESKPKVEGMPDIIRWKMDCGGRSISIQPLRWTIRSASCGLGKGPGIKTVSGTDITKQLRKLKFMRLF
jgi:hypothetical protein